MKGLAEYESRLTSAATKNLRPDSVHQSVQPIGQTEGLGLMEVNRW
jgi:hypothetical protein